MSAGAGQSQSRRRWRLSGNKKAHVDSVRNDINVTPLVDVMLVLLIIFMLMTLVMGRGHDVKLPSAKYYSAEKDKSQPVVTLELEKGGSVALWVEKNRLGPVNEATLKEMEGQVRAAWKAPKNPEGVDRIYLKADVKLEYKDVYPVLEYMNRDMAMQSVDLAIAKDSEEK